MADVIRGDDEDIINEMNRFHNTFSDRMAELDHAPLPGLDPSVSALLARHAESAQTHLSKGVSTAQGTIEAARGRMEVADTAAGRLNQVSTNITGGGSGSLATQALQRAAATSPTRQATTTPRTTAKQAGPLRGPSATCGSVPRTTHTSSGSYTPTASATPVSASSPQQATYQPPQQATYQPQASHQPVTTHTTAGGSTPTYTPPSYTPTTPPTAMRVPPTAHAPSSLVIPTTPQQGRDLYTDAVRQRAAVAANPSGYTPQQARAAVAAQNAAHNTPAAASERARNYLDASQRQAQAAAAQRAALNEQAYREQQERVRARQEESARFLREQQERESARYKEMLDEMRQRSVDDLPTRRDTSGIDTLRDFSEQTPTHFDAAEDAGRAVPREVYNKMLVDMMADIDAEEHQSNQAAADLGMNKAELQERIYQLLKEEDAHNQSLGQTFATQAGIDAGYPTSTVLPVGGDADDADAIELANQYVAAQIPYAWGGGHGATPGPSQGVSDGGGYADACGDYNKIGLDCSGLARDYTWNLYGVDINGTAASQYASGMPIAPEDARPGDIFFPDSAGRPPGHVTVYIGNNSMLEAQQSGTIIGISPLPSGEFRRYVQ